MNPLDLMDIFISCVSSSLRPPILATSVLRPPTRVTSLARDLQLIIATREVVVS